MTREQHLVFCKKCSNRKMDMQKGIICSLTEKQADFTEKCPDFKLDEKIKNDTLKNIELIRPNKQRAKIAQILIWSVMLFDIISGISSYLQYNLLTSLQNGETFSDDILNANDTREQIVGILYIVIFIASAVTFIQWFRRAYYNLNLRTNCDHTDGWAAGSWFVPIISLFRPYQIMKEMWIETSKLIKLKTPDFNINNSTLIIGLWWALWIISNYIGNYVLKNAFKAGTIDDLLNSTIGDITMSTIGIPLAILTVLMIKSYSSMEEKIAELEKNE